MSKAYVFLADGFEEVEALAVVDLLRRADVPTEMVSVTEKREVCGSHGIGVLADRLFSDGEFADARVLVLPGGMPGTNALAAHEGLSHLLAKAQKNGVRLAAICAAPTVLGRLGLLEGKRAVCYPGMEAGLLGAKVPDARVVTDGLVTTSRGMGTAIDFGLELVRLLKGEDEAHALAKKIVYAAPEA